jgi:uncharacterized protein (DUF433 family)
MRIDRNKYIKVDSDIHHGKPCLAGTRVPVSTIVGSVADGMTFDEILDKCLQLKKETIQAALAYAQQRLSAMMYYSPWQVDSCR